MLIVLPSDFCDLNDNSLDFYNCIENILLASYEGSHFVIAETPKTVRSMLDWQDISLRGKAALAKIENDSRLHHAVITNLSQFIEISSFKSKKIQTIKCSSKGIETDLSFFDSSESIQPCILLCENSRDGEIYSIYYSILFNNKSESAISTLNFDIRHGGGTTIIDEYRKIINLKKIVVCIADSDKIEPGYDGEYFKKLSRIGTTSFANFYIINAHEIENTIPPSVLHDECDMKTSSMIYDLVIKSFEDGKMYHLYLDYKKGIVKSDLRKLSKGYRDEFIAFICNAAKIDHDIFSCIDLKCMHTCTNCKVMHGFGENILDKLWDRLKRSSRQKQKELLCQDTLMNVLGDYLPTIIDRGIASSKIRL